MKLRKINQLRNGNVLFAYMANNKGRGRDNCTLVVVPGGTIRPRMAQLVDGPGHGELTFYDDGSFVYTPAEGFYGTDSFTYKASDGADDSNEATVTIQVNPAAE